LKRILIISEYFAPENMIGAIRMTKVAKYLTYKGYIVDVVAAREINMADPILENDSKVLNQIIRVPHSALFRKCYNVAYKITKRQSPAKGAMKRQSETFAKSKGKKTARSAIWTLLKEIRDTILSLYKDYDFFINAKKPIKESIDLKNYYAIISSYKSMASHLIARKIKKEHKGILWIADFRDPIDPTAGRLSRALFKMFEVRFCNLADVITTVSNGFLGMLGNKSHDCKKRVITNGYDPGDVKEDKYIQSYKERYLKDRKFHLSYIGSVYQDRQKITPIFRAIKDLSDEGIVDLKSISINYAGLCGDEFIKQAQECQLENTVCNRGFVNRIDSLELQLESDILLAASWNDGSYQGVIPGKLLEYMLIRKPVVAYIAGEQPQSEARIIIERCNIGIAIEETEGVLGDIRLKKYLKEQYIRFKEEKKTIYLPNKEIVEEYSYTQLIDKWISIIEMR